MGSVSKMLSGMHTPHFRAPGTESAPLAIPAFTHNVHVGRQLKCLGSCHPHGRTAVSSGLLALTILSSDHWDI